MGYYTSYQQAFSNAIWCDQTAAVCTTFTDPESRTRCQRIRAVDCTGGDCSTLVVNNGLLLCAEDQGWNCDLCANDLPYYNPVQIGDTIDFQFQQFDDLNVLGPSVWNFTHGWGGATPACNIYMKDCCSGDFFGVPGTPQELTPFYFSKYYVSSYLTQQYNGIGQSNPIQSVRAEITNSLISDFQAQFPTSNCFYFVFEFYFGGTTITYYSEPFNIPNSCKNTLVIESKYGKFDCNKYWYQGLWLGGLGNDYIGVPFFFSNKIRIPAYIERTSFTISKDVVGRRLNASRSQTTENFKLKTERIPEKLAIYLANILSGEEIYIGNGTFVMDGEITKNNDTGNQWFLEADLKRVNCNVTFSCNS